MFLKKVVVVWAAVALVALLPSAICRPQHARGILMDTNNRAMKVAGASLTPGAGYTMQANFDRADPAVYFNTSWQDSEVFRSQSSFQITSKFNGMCVTAAATGSGITQQNCVAGNNYQLWKYNQNLGDPYADFVLQNKGTLQCLAFGGGGTPLVYQKTCPYPLVWTLGGSAWRVEQFALVSNPGVLRSVSTGKCFTRGEDNYYYLKPCTAKTDTQNQPLWMWDNTAWLNQGQPWYGPDRGKRCTSTSSADFTQILEIDSPGPPNYFQNEQQWINIGNVDYQFQIQNVRSRYCLDANFAANGQKLRMSDCTGAVNTLWVRSHASPLMSAYGEACHGHTDCLSNSCTSPTAGTCNWGSTGDGCRKDADCRSNKCRQGQCECRSHADPIGDTPPCRENVPADCCSGNCQLNDDGVGVCGCHSFWQPCNVNGDCCSNSCDPVYKICKCLVSGLFPASPFAIGSLGAGFLSTPGLCCSGEVDAQSFCGKGEVGTYCETNNDCKQNNCNVKQSTCSCGGSDCTTGGDGYCKTCFGRGSVCRQNQCCYEAGIAVPCNTRGASNGHADNSACCDGRCAGSGGSCAAGRLDNYCSSGGPVCITRKSEKSKVFGWTLDFGD